MKLNSFDLKSKTLKANAQEIEVNFGKEIDGFNLVVPQSAPIKLSKLFAFVKYKDWSASLRLLMNDEGKLTTMSETLVDVPPRVIDILYFDGSSEQSK